ncbi:MAG: hypothetical protein VYE27_01235 [Pseudomonadota bacterium]|nr:hypothetical protein [Pseudomonadota bacterium]
MKSSLKEYESNAQKELSNFKIIFFHGSDWKKITKKSVEAANAICGENSETELRLHKFSEPAILKDNDLFFTALQTRSFFPGKQAIIIENGTEKLTKVISECLDQIIPDDGHVIITAGSLKASSALRKLLDPHPKCLSVAVYDESLDNFDIEKILKQNELVVSDQEALHSLINHEELSSAEDLESFLEKLKLYKLYDEEPVSKRDIQELLHGKSSVKDQDLPHFLVMGQAPKMLKSLRGLALLGRKPNQISIYVLRHFTLLYQVKLNTSNLEVFFRTLSPPVFGKRKSDLLAQANLWNLEKLERALKILRNLDKDLRSSSRINPFFIVERSFLRIISLLKSFS